MVSAGARRDAFTLLGLLKLYGLAYGIEGGQGKPLETRLCGT